MTNEAGPTVGKIELALRFNASALAIIASAFELALPLLREDRASTFESLTAGGDPTTLDDDARVWIDRYDTAIGALEAGVVSAVEGIEAERVRAEAARIQRQAREAYLSTLERVVAQTVHFFEQGMPGVQIDRIAGLAADLMAKELTGQTIAASMPAPKVVL